LGPKWAAQWRSRNRLDGYCEHLCFEPVGIPKLFTTRAAARAWIKERYGYIAQRPDLRREPHGWMMPRPVRVKISIL
jgi:hypothetical protein